MHGFFVPPTRGRSMFAGKMQKSVTPATASPAPRSNSVSVNDGTSDTTRDGGVAKSKVRPRTSFIASIKKPRQECLCHINPRAEQDFCLCRRPAGTRKAALRQAGVAQTLLSVLVLGR